MDEWMNEWMNDVMQWIHSIDMLIEDNFPETFADNAEFIYSAEEQVKDYLDANQGLTSKLDDIAKQFNYNNCLQVYLRCQWKYYFHYSR